jgi:hypothetical protein
MRNDAKAAYRLLWIVTASCLIPFAGCRKSPDVMEGEPLSDVLLRYTPQVGQTLKYKVFMNLDKKLFENGKWLSEGNERVQMALSMTAVELTTEGYRTKAGVSWGRSTFSKETADEMKDKAEAAQSTDLIVSDRYVWNTGGTHNLCLPDEPVSPGDEWSGSALFMFGDLATVEAPTLDVSYRLVRAVKNDQGRYCLIECRPDSNQVDVPLQIGQLGLQCDETGTVTALREDSDAQGKINVGDVLVAVSGHPAATAKDWHVLYERFIEPPSNVGTPVALTVKRDGQELDVEVTKTFATLGTMAITLSEAVRKVVFDVDRGIIISDEASPQYSVMYDFLEEVPFVDQYMGAGSFTRDAGAKVGPRVYHNQHRMTLVP